MKITLNEDESVDYLNLQDKYDSVIGTLMAEAEKAIARDADIETMRVTIQQLEATLEAKERIIEIQSDVGNIPVGDSSRVFRDSALARDLDEEYIGTQVIPKDITYLDERPTPPWQQDLQTLADAPSIDTPTTRTRWSAEEKQAIVTIKNKSGIYSGTDIEAIMHLFPGRTRAAVVSALWVKNIGVKKGKLKFNLPIPKNTGGN